MPAALALSPTCLRCQLHVAVRQTGKFPTTAKHVAQRCWAFSTHHSRTQETDNWQFRGSNKGGTKWRSVTLSDENHETRPKPVIVLEDTIKKGKAKKNVKDNPQQAEYAVVVGKNFQEDAIRSPSAKQIENVVSERHKSPSQTDINASLEAMRVEATNNSSVMGTSKFEDLLRDLAKGYTIHQLGRYLDQSLRSPSRKVYELQTSRWRPGRTPLSQRHIKEVLKKGPSTKLSVAEQILRLVWEITVESEENRDGELEITLQPWQMALLFDFKNNGGRYLDGLITPQTLLQSSKVQQFRPCNVMRISGRCQTAEEIARQLKLALLKVHRLEWDLKPLTSSVDASSVAPTAVFRSEDIGYVAQLTESVILSESDSRLAIYSRERTGTLNARRLLLALLDRVDESYNEIVSSIDGVAGATFALPIGNSTVGVHRRYHGLELLRTVTPVAAKIGRPGEGTSSTRAYVDESALSLARQLDLVERAKLTGAPTEQGTSYWRRQSLSTAWKASYCMLLQPRDKDQVWASDLEEAARPRSIIQHATPGLETLLACFEAPTDSESSYSANKFSKQSLKRKMLPYIKVHLKPLSQDRNSTTTLPRLELRFNFSESKTGAGSHGLVLTGMQAVFDEQRLSVPLPGYVTDVQFTRKSRLLAKLDAVKSDASVMAFVRNLQRSARDDKGALTAPAELWVKLPLWLLQPDGSENSAASQEITAKYLFERFEQIQKLKFAPRLNDEQDLEMDADIKSTLERLPKHLRLDYREIEGGAIYGNNSVLSLDVERKHRDSRTRDIVEEQSEQTSSTATDSSSLELAGSALQIAHLLTCANAGGLKAFEGESVGV